MKLKGALWAASLFIFSLAAYLAIPTQTLRNHTMSASSITRAVTKKVLAVETPEGQGALGTSANIRYSCRILNMFQFAEVLAPRAVRAHSMLSLRPAITGINSL